MFWCLGVSPVGSGGGGRLHCLVVRVFHQLLSSKPVNSHLTVSGVMRNHLCILCNLCILCICILLQTGRQSIRTYLRYYEISSPPKTSRNKKKMYSMGMYFEKKYFPLIPILCGRPLSVSGNASGQVFSHKVLSAWSACGRTLLHYISLRSGLRNTHII